MARAWRNGRFGTMAQMRRLLAIHMHVMTGPSRRERDFHSVFRYLLGSWTPAKTNCTPRTRRLKYRVTALRLACEPVYSSGRTKLVAWGEKMTPARRDITVYCISKLRDASEA